MTENQIKKVLQTIARLRTNVEEPFIILKVLLTLSMDEIEQVMSVCDTIRAMVDKVEEVLDEEHAN